MPYEQPADTISSGSLSAENAAELFKPHRKAVAGEPAGDTADGDEHEGEDAEETREDTEDSEDESPDEDAAETEQGDDEESSEDEEAEADESDEEEPAKKLHTVKVDGKESKVTLDQMKKDYAFTAHNTRRAQELAEKEKGLSSKEVEIAENARAYAERLEQVKEALAAITPKEPDWDKLQKENPAKFAEQWAAWAKHKEGLAKLDTEQKEAIKKVQEAEQKQFDAHLASENDKLVAALPTWKDPKVRVKEVAAMTEFAKSIGFTEAELSTVIDHRAVLLLRNAYKYSQAQKVRPDVEKRVSEVKSLTPGNSSSAPGRTSVANKAVERLEKTGTVDDAVAALQAMRAVGGRPRRR